MKTHGVRHDQLGRTISGMSCLRDSVLCNVKRTAFGDETPRKGVSYFLATGLYKPFYNIP